MIKSINPKMKIVVGNTVASTIPKLALEHLYCDIVVMFEGEITSVELLDTIENNISLRNVEGIWYKDKEGIHENKRRPFIKNLDEIDFPAWDLFEIDKYSKNNIIFGGRKTISIIAVRGCPYSCNYCCKVFGRVARFRSPENIIKEIRILKEKYGIDYFHFNDELFTINKKFIIDFCNKLIDSKLDVKWRCVTRVNTIDEEILIAMKKAGCNFIGYGVESGCNKILNNMNKRQTKDDIARAVKLIRKVGINDFPSFMIGYPGENEETIKESVQFAIDNYLPATFFYTTAYPSTVLYNQWKDKIIEKYGSEDAYLEKLYEPNKKPLMNFTEMTKERYIEMRNWAEATLRKNLRLIIYRVYKYFKSTGLSGFNKLAFIRAKELLFGKN